VHALAPALLELTTRVWDQGNQHFQPTTFQVSNLNAGTGAPNVIPGELKARFNIRFSTEQTVAGLQQTVESILNRHRVKSTLEWFLSGNPFFTPPGTLSSAVSRAVRDVTGLTPALSTGGGTSDGRFIAPTGAAVVELGVVNASIHKVNEHVRVEDIETLTAFMRACWTCSCRLRGRPVGEGAAAEHGQADRPTTHTNPRNVQSMTPHSPTSASADHVDERKDLQHVIQARATTPDQEAGLDVNVAGHDVPASATRSSSTP
jgi:hypothetical protein